MKDELCIGQVKVFLWVLGVSLELGGFSSPRFDPRKSLFTHHMCCAVALFPSAYSDISSSYQSSELRSSKTRSDSD